MDQIKIQTFFKKHVADLVVLCRNEWSYGFDDHEKQIDPLIAVNDALGIDATGTVGAQSCLHSAGEDPVQLAECAGRELGAFGV